MNSLPESSLQAGRYLGLACILACSFAGCGGDSGPERFHVSGSVTYKGEPVPRGTVTFFPDISKGTNGPTSQVTITEGKYDSDTNLQGNKSPIAGSFIVEVEGYGPPAPNEEVPKKLFKTYQTELTIKEAAIFDIEVPAKK